MPSFTRDELEWFRDHSVADIAGDGMKLLFVGINPGLWTAATQTHFAHPGNRFYPALFEAGIIEQPIDRAAGFTPDDRTYLVRRGIGITNLVNRATARADELSTDELRRGAVALTGKVADWSPKVVAIVGITAYRTAFSRSKAASGRQPEALAGAGLWVLGNPSGLNAHETIGSLAASYAEPAREAGIL